MSATRLPRPGDSQAEGTEAYGGGAMAAQETLKRVLTDTTLGYLNSSKRTAKDTLFSTLEDFTRADPTKKRLVVIGCTGSGKSTLLNLLGGWRFVQSKDNDYQYVWQPKGDGDAAKPPLFEAAASSDSVTKKSSFANVEFRGERSREIVVVDTPGHDDPAGCEIDSQEARDVLGAIAADLHNKLKALGHVHTLLVLHNEVHSNRLNPATYQMLKMVDEKFKLAGTSVWEHVVVGYSKCNTHETSWRSGLDGKKKNLQASIREKIAGCEVDVPVLALGGAEIDPPPPSHDEVDGLEKLWEFINESEALDTSQLQPFEGADVKWQKMIDARDEAEARAKAALICVPLLIKLFILSTCLFWRHMLPMWHSIFLLNMPGLVDECAILALFVYWVGPQDTLYSLKHAYTMWIGPRVEPYIEAYLGPTWLAPKKKEE